MPDTAGKVEKMKEPSGKILPATPPSGKRTFGSQAEPYSGAAVEMPVIWFLMILTGVVWYLCWIMAAPFLSAVTWAFALSVVVHPIRRRLISKWPKTAVAVVILALVGATIALSLYVISHRLILEAGKAQQLLQSFSQPAVWERLAQSGTRAGSVWRWAQSQFDLEAIGKEASAAVARNLGPAFGKSAVGLSRALFSLLFFFFFVRDQEALIEGLRGLLPLTPSESDRLFDRTTATVQATVIARTGIAAIQGAIGGILFLLVGIPAPLFWSIVMGVLSMLPVFGAFIVWIPASVSLLVSGHWIRALILFTGGVVLIHPVDNIVYPLFVGPGWAYIR